MRLPKDKNGEIGRDEIKALVLQFAAEEGGGDDEKAGMIDEQVEIEEALRDIGGVDGKVDFEAFFAWWARISDPGYDKTWWQAHWPKVAALGFCLVVLVTIIIAVVAGSSSEAGTILLPPPPPPVPPPPDVRVAPPVIIGYNFTFALGFTEDAVRRQLTDYLGLVAPDAISSAENSRGTSLWNVAIRTANIQRGV